MKKLEPLEALIPFVAAAAPVVDYEAPSPCTGAGRVRRLRLMRLGTDEASAVRLAKLHARLFT